MFIALCGDKGAPGVTTAALALASAWQGPATVVEANPAGGDLAIRLHPQGSPLPETPTVLSVITAARNKPGEDPVGSHAHTLNTTTSVVPGATMAEQHAKIGDWAPLADALGRSKTPVFADLGHLHASSPVVGLAAQADVVVVVSRPDMPSIVRLRERLIRLASDLARVRGAAPNLFPLLLSTSRHGQADVADLRAILAETPANPFLVGAGFIALDPAAVRRLEAGEDPAGRLSRTDLLRSAQAVTRQIERLAQSSSRRDISALRGLS